MTLRIGMVGPGFMAQIHSAAYRLLPGSTGTPCPGIGLGWQQGFVALLGAFLQDLTTDSENAPTLQDGVVVSGYLDCVLEASRTRAWTSTR